MFMKELDKLENVKKYDCLPVVCLATIAALII